MATKRVNVSFNNEEIDFLAALAAYENKHIGTVVHEMVAEVIENMENEAWLKIALQRQEELETTGEKCIPWEQVKEMFKDKR